MGFLLPLVVEMTPVEIRLMENSDALSSHKVIPSESEESHKLGAFLP